MIYIIRLGKIKINSDKFLESTGTRITSTKFSANKRNQKKEENWDQFHDWGKRKRGKRGSESTRINDIDDHSEEFILFEIYFKKKSLESMKMQFFQWSINVSYSEEQKCIDRKISFLS